MPKNVSELEGAELDYWAARADGFELVGMNDSTRPMHRESLDCPGETFDDWESKGPHKRLEHSDGRVVYLCGCSHKGDDLPEYSSDWSIAGPIIERENISLTNHAQGGARALSEWCAKMVGSSRLHFGPTPLIAAMRAFVCSVFGDTVDA